MQEIGKERPDRFKGDLVAAALIRRPNGDIFLVSRGNEWTIPTGHLDPEREQELDKTLIREMGEEIFSGSEGEEEIFIKSILGVVTREAKEGNGKKTDAKIITIYFCLVDEKTAKIMEYKEKGEMGFRWVSSLRELLERGEIEGGLPIDQLAKEALELYLKGYKETAMVRVGKWFTEKLKIIFRRSAP